MADLTWQLRVIDDDITATVLQLLAAASDADKAYDDGGMGSQFSFLKQIRRVTLSKVDDSYPIQAQNLLS